MEEVVEVGPVSPSLGRELDSFALERKERSESGLVVVLSEGLRCRPRERLSGVAGSDVMRGTGRSLRIVSKRSGVVERRKVKGTAPRRSNSADTERSSDTNSASTGSNNSTEAGSGGVNEWEK